MHFGGTLHLLFNISGVCSIFAYLLFWHFVMNCGGIVVSEARLLVSHQPRGANIKGVLCMWFLVDFCPDWSGYNPYDGFMRN